MKKCSIANCIHGGKLQPYSEFYKCPGMKSGYGSNCKTCIKASYNYIKVKDRVRNDWNWIYEN